MKAIWFLTARQLRRGGWRSGLALCSALLSVVLLSGTLLGWSRGTAPACWRPWCGRRPGC